MSKNLFLLLVGLLFCTGVNAEITYKTYNPVVQRVYNKHYDYYTLSRPKHNYKKTIKQSLNDYFLGQMTGFTPQINPLPSTHANTYNYSSNDIYPHFNSYPFERQNQIQY